MTTAEIQTTLRLPFQRERWITLLKSLFPEIRSFTTPQLLHLEKEQAKSAVQLATLQLADGKNVAVIEVEVSGRVDVQRNRVGLRAIVANLIDQDKAHAVIGLFYGEGSADGDYRFSFVAKSSEFSADGELSRTETEKRRYTYILGRGQPCRTPAERLVQLQRKGREATIEDLLAAFKVEPLFEEFYKDYDRLFKEVVKPAIRPSLPDEEQLHLFTQRLFNRLMFLAFIERKGWLKMGRRTDYLEALWDSYAGTASDQATGYYRSRLAPLFFEGLNQADRPTNHVDPRFGSVPYLNGGLFEKAEDGSDDHHSITVPDSALQAVKEQLFDRYNFTVAESTPLDVEVAVDPEMLGKVFEELVTGRHEQGSYYTPKPIVSFMCREALVGYLADRCRKEDRAALESFVHDHKPDRLRDAEAVLAALKAVTVCDPACGSGAYLLGMLHELLDLRTCLFHAAQKLDGVTAHARKLDIIERNLYGVDKDAFAVNIARLRLWLSLSVEYDGATPPPALPNLDFKIEQGDSLAAPAPSEVLQDAGSLPLLMPTVRDFAAKKARFLTAHGEDKAKLKKEITKLKDSLKTWLATEGPADAFHWALEFAEVFLPSQPAATMLGELALVNQAQKQQDLLALDTLVRDHTSQGFDIVVANPPYVRMELIKPQKPVLRKRFPHVHAERADLYVYFYARAHDLLREGGTAAFISSNKWLRAGYGEPLRQHLLDAQAFEVVMDFGELRVFKAAATDAAIFIWRKEPRDKAETRWAMVKDLARCYAEGVRSHFESLKVLVPTAQFGKGKPRLASTATADLRSRMEKSGPTLSEICGGLLGWGIKTGLNEAKFADGTRTGVFVIDQETRDRLVDACPAADEIIKPLIAGDDVRRSEIHYRGSYIIYTYHGVDIRRYESVERHLKPFRSFVDEKGEVSGLDHRATKQEWFELQQPQMAYRRWFDGAKILYPEIGKEPRFVIETEGRYINNKCFFLPSADWYLVAVLNSASVFAYLKEVCALLGDKDKGGRLEFRSQYLETLPIPSADDADRATVGSLAQQAQALHTERRTRTERFLRDLGVDPAESNSRSPLEQPWSLPPAEFAKRAKPFLRAARERPQELYETARDETAAFTEQIARIEAEIDARVAALYGLDAEDQRWSAKAAPAAQPDDKSALFYGILGALKERQAYFSHTAVQKAVNEAELQIPDEVLNVYLTQAVKQGLIHDAGRGMYSRLSEPVKLDLQPVAKLIKALEKAFPLLDFNVWSTAQLNPWMHHLIAQPVAFVYAAKEALESVADLLREKGWEVSINPGKRAAPKEVRPGEKMVVLRPLHSKQPSPHGHQSAVEQVLVELAIESEELSLMDQSEVTGASHKIVESGLVQVPQMLRFADFRRVVLPVFVSVN